MRIDLNYWDDVDWKREHSGNPVFLYLGIGLIFILISLGWLSFKHAELSGLESELAKLKEQAENLLLETAPITKKSDYSKMVKTKVLTGLQQMEQARMVCSRNLEVIPAIVPDEMVLINFVLRGDRAKLTKSQIKTAKVKGLKTTSPLVYQMAFAGTVKGDLAEAEQAVAKFSYDLASDKGFGTQLKSAKLENIGKVTNVKTGSAEISFTVSCIFNDLQ